MSSSEQAKPSAGATTPAMKQYAEQKAQVGDAILFFRMGDFYETFYDDAKTVAKALGLALTSRNKDDNPIPLAGVPYHAVDNYLARLVRAGYKVAISEQIEDPKLAKGVVKRKVVRIVTPGTLTEQNLLNEREGNYLACCALGGSDGSAAGLAWIELSTGEFRTLRLSQPEIIDELVRIRPAEVLLPELEMGNAASASASYRKLVRQIQETLDCAVTHRPGWWFDASQAAETLRKHFAVAGLEGFGFERQADQDVAAAGAIVQYLDETQKTALGHIRNLTPVRRTHYLQLDQTTIRSLELERTIRSGTRDGTLLDVMDQTGTAMGSRLLRQWLLFPLKELDPIVMRQDAVDLLLQRPDLVRQLRSSFNEFADLERIVARIGTGRASPRDLAALGETLGNLPKIVEVLEPLRIVGSLLEQTVERFEGFEELATRLGKALADQPPANLRDGGVIADGFNEELDRLRSISRDGQSWLAQFQTREIERTGIPSLKVGYNQVFGYYIEITHAQARKAPDDYVRRQTLKNAERYITDELKRYEEEQLTAQQRSLDLETRLFEELRRGVAEHIDRVQRCAAAVAQLDVLVCFAYVASMRGYCRPEIITEPILKIVQGRHPVLDVTLAEKFVANDTDLCSDRHAMMIITGPNMAGKSTYIRQVALLTLLAQTGSFVPAKLATVGLCDRIFTRVGASDELTRGQSTFMVEMTEAANIVNNATRHSLVILDEIGRGTSTYDGLSLAWAIAEHLAGSAKPRTLFATHYHELTELEQLIDGVRNYNILVREWHDEIIFLHRIARGGTDKSYGIHVARLAGLPKEVIGRARVILGELERAFSRELKTSDLAERKPEQELFDLPHDSVAAELREMEIEKITPLEALQILQDLKNRVSGA